MNGRRRPNPCVRGHRQTRDLSDHRWQTYLMCSRASYRQRSTLSSRPGRFALALRQSHPQAGAASRAAHLQPGRWNASFFYLMNRVAAGAFQSEHASPLCTFLFYRFSDHLSSDSGPTTPAYFWRKSRPLYCPAPRAPRPRCCPPRRCPGRRCRAARRLARVACRQSRFSKGYDFASSPPIETGASVVGCGRSQRCATRPRRPP